MSFFNQYKKISIIKKQQETMLYEIVMNEIEEGFRHKGSYGKALVKCQGDEKKAEAEYIKLRVEDLKDFILLNDIIEDEKLRAVKELEKQNEILNKTKKIKDVSTEEIDIVEKPTFTMSGDDEAIRQEAKRRVAERMDKLNKK